MKTFEVPEFYRSPIITQIKNIRKDLDPKKKDFTPTVLDFGPVKFILARHFGFCYGVENAIEISYKAITENPGKNIYLLSEMIHNPSVNADLQSYGIQFIMDTSGKQLIPWEKIQKEDVVIIPAFGTTLEIMDLLEKKGVLVNSYNTTCPFVERVWKMSEKLGKQEYTIVIHGKYNHEETRATFSHAAQDGPAIVIKNIEEAELLSKFIRKELGKEDFYKVFANRYSEGFDPEIHLRKIGVVNQTTMLASETKEIAAYIKKNVELVYGEGKDSFADTRDSLCYATNDNQSATFGLMEQSADLAIVVGGYNSSNTTHLAELCEEKYPTFFINSDDKILNSQEISHFNFHTETELITTNYIPQKEVVEIIITSGASCPDALVEKVLQKLLSFFPVLKNTDEVLEEIKIKYQV